MEQRTTISNVSDIRHIAGEIGMFHIRRRMISVQLNQFTEEENRLIERKIVKQYAMQHALLSASTGLGVTVLYVLLIVSGIITLSDHPRAWFIGGYILFFGGAVVLQRVFRCWYSRKVLRRLADQLPAVPPLAYQ